MVLNTILGLAIQIQNFMRRTKFLDQIVMYITIGILKNFVTENIGPTLKSLKLVLPDIMALFD